MGKDMKTPFFFLVVGILVAGILASSSLNDDSTGAAIRSSSRTTLPSSSLSLAQEIQETIPDQTLQNPIANTNRRASSITASEITNDNTLPDSFDSTSKGYQKPLQRKVEYAKGNLIVQFNENPSLIEESGSLSTSLESINTLNSKYDVSNIVELFPNIEDPSLKNTYLLVFPEDKSVEEALVDYGQDFSITYAEPNSLAKISARPVIQRAIPPPNDPLYPQQWHLPKVSASQAWASLTNITNLSSAPVIAVIDTGVQWSHPDLANNIWVNTGEIPNNNVDDDTNGFIDDVRGWDFVETTSSYCSTGEDCSVEDNDSNDFHGHGTHVAGIAGAVTNNNLGVAGACWFCKVMSVRAGFSVGNPPNGGSLEYDDIAQSLVYAADNGANVISMSFGGSDSLTLQNAVNYAYSQGVVLVAATGNSNTGSTIEAFPAAYSNVISVAATDQNDQKASFSNYGSWVDIAAPGVNILSTVIPGVTWGCVDTLG
ncbi:MAG: S8 family serine peptidase, partial [Candidatus Woesearchaeota archaeon]|nr:S8 family serine peptidase [Candidatus Woesearchaeota archaeon]